MKPYNPATEELTPIAGDFGTHEIQNDISDENYTSKGHGTTKFHKMAHAHPQIRYKDFLITTDLYKSGDELNIHIICPRCRHSLSIPSSKKQMEYDDATGRLNIEPFQCTWELDADRHEFGIGLCRWRVGVKDNIAVDA